MLLIALNAVVWLVELGVPEGDLQTFFMTYGVVPAQFTWATLGTSMFLHGGWLHFLGNMLYLWIFGDNVEDRTGHVRFMAFYLLCGAAAGVAHVASVPHSMVPTIGASGAIAGVLGAYFFLYPHSRVLALVPLLVFWDVIEVPAVFFLGIWFVVQVLSGVATLPGSSGEGGAGIAFWAHVVGFATGIFGVVVFRRRERQRVEWWG